MNGDADSPTASGQSRTELCLVAPFSEAAFGKHLFGVVGGEEDLLAELRSRTSLGGREGEPRAAGLRLQDGFQFPQSQDTPFHLCLRLTALSHFQKS